MKVVYTDKAPKAIGPYSQGVCVGNFLFISGQIALDPLTMTIVSDNIKDQTRQILDNITAIVSAANATLKDVIHCTVYLKNIDNFDALNEIWTEYFGDWKPSRTTVEIGKLAKNALLEIDAIASLENNDKQ